MSNIEKIRQEIERLYDSEAPKHDQQCGFDDGYFTGLATISNFIDTLPEEKPSEDLNDEILEILDAVGESNVVICDVPTADRFVLTVLFAVAERQAIMIRVKTQLALAERKKQIEKNGGFFSKSGHWRKHLGNEKGVDVSAAAAVQARNKADEARAWRESSDGYRWIKKQVQKGRLQKDILREFNEFHEMGLAGFSTREGCKMNACTLSKWIQEIRRQN